MFNNKHVIILKVKINRYVLFVFILSQLLIVSKFIVQMRIQIKLPVVAFNLFLSVVYYSLANSFENPILDFNEYVACVNPLC